MKRITIIALPTLAVLLPSLGCSSSNRDALMDAARTEFHRRWAAKQFHEIYMNSIDAETHPERAARSEEHSALLWRNYGTFVRDTRDLGTYGFEGQYAGRNACALRQLAERQCGERGVFRRLLVVCGGAPVEQCLGAEGHPRTDEPGLQELPPDDRV